MDRMQWDISALSVKLSEVLTDLGVNDEVARMRRQMSLLLETIENIHINIAAQKYRVPCGRIYRLGSKSEGSFVPGLESDSDFLTLYHGIIVLDVSDEPEPDVLNLLRMMNDSIYPGYCLLQMPYEMAEIPEFFKELFSVVEDSLGRVLLRNTKLARSQADGQRQGPAWTKVFRENYADRDAVTGFVMKSWPQEAQKWLNDDQRWPSGELKQRVTQTQCFVVPTGSKSGRCEEVEWRISFSLAERELMFGLNITQLRCYTLMKILLKEFVNPYCSGITSYMCKTVLFHCTEKCPTGWSEPELILCLSKCLNYLYRCVSERNCPHVIIPENNLMSFRISQDQRDKLCFILADLQKNLIERLFQIKINAIGGRLHAKLSNILTSDDSMYIYQTAYQLTVTAARTVHAMLRTYVYSFALLSAEEVLKRLIQYISIVAKFYSSLTEGEKEAYHITARHVCISIGSILSACSIQKYQHVSREAMFWLYAGCRADAASARLKLVSAFQHSGDLEEERKHLTALESVFMDSLIECVCGCQWNDEFRVIPMLKFSKQCYQSLLCGDVTLRFTANCVAFLPCEMDIIPRELQYEVFRSTIFDAPYKAIEHFWFRCSVVDATPYLYFLLYKSKVPQWSGKAIKESILLGLADFINTPCRALGHRETALNLLGQCLELEERPRASLLCYTISLSLRREHNAARVLVCCLLAKQLKQRGTNMEQRVNKRPLKTLCSETGTTHDQSMKKRITKKQ